MDAEPLTYSLPPNARYDYAMSVTFDGFIPILGGQEGKAEVKLGFQLQGLEPKDGRAQAASELTSAEFIFNGAKLPLGLDNVQDFFPRTTIAFLPTGQILATDAPDISLPVKLPGLDVKRFPDISYLPVQFSAEPAAQGLKWSFQKPFGDSNVTYTCEVIEMTEAEVKLSVRVLQSYTVFEDSSLNVVPDPKVDAESEAENRVTTTVEGKGLAVFDRVKQVFRSYTIKAEAKSKVEPLASGQPSERKLSTDLKVDLKTS